MCELIVSYYILCVLYHNMHKSNCSQCHISKASYEYSIDMSHTSKQSTICRVCKKLYDHIRYKHGSMALWSYTDKVGVLDTDDVIIDKESSGINVVSTNF